jgi:hypothetical protein
MNLASRLSLEGSIELWRLRVSGRELHVQCPLRETHPLCDRCPVYLKTGQKFCQDTPFWDWKMTSPDALEIRSVMLDES